MLYYLDLPRLETIELGIGSFCNAGTVVFESMLILFIFLSDLPSLHTLYIGDAAIKMYQNPRSLVMRGLF